MTGLTSESAAYLRGLIDGIDWQFALGHGRPKELVGHVDGARCINMLIPVRVSTEIAMALLSTPTVGGDILLMAYLAGNPLDVVL